MSKRRASWTQLVLALLIAYVAFVYLAGSLAAYAVNEGMMLRQMQRYADTSASGIDEASYPVLAQAITGYLKGKTQSAQVQLSTQQGERSAFSDEELLHLEDVRGLVRLGAQLRILALIVILLALLYYAVARKWRPNWLQGIRLDRALVVAAWLVLVPLLIMGLWALVDFEGLFHAFHRLLFINELWLLDPQRDVLLQLMPLPFFVSYALEFLKQNVFLLLALPLAAFGLRTAKKKVDQVAAR